MRKDPRLSRLDLHAGSLMLSLAPEFGGGIARFAKLGSGGALELLRPAPERIEDVRQTACFPLVPYSNRIRDGRFSFGGRTITLPANMPGQRHSMHGLGWRAAWTITHRNANSAELTFRHQTGAWPWAFEAFQCFTLDETGLWIGLGVRNLSDDPMPAGLGLHPYFLCDAQTRLSARTSRVWMVDDELLPLRAIPAAGRHCLQNRLMFEQSLDNGHEGWDGEAIIAWRDIGLRMGCPSTHYFQIFSPRPGAGLYAPPGWGIFAAEPVTHANAALNLPEAEWADAGLKILRHGEQALLEVRFDILTVPSK